jgi:hypothetical protein
MNEKSVKIVRSIIKISYENYILIIHTHHESFTISINNPCSHHDDGFILQIDDNVKSALVSVSAFSIDEKFPIILLMIKKSL